METEKAVKEPTLTERVDKLIGIVDYQSNVIEQLTSRTNVLRRQLQKVIPDFPFDDEPQTETVVPWRGPEKGSTYHGRELG